MNAKKVLLVVLLLTTPSLLFAQDAPLTLEVGLDITADENIKGSISSYIRRELRSLGDVTINDERPMYDLIMICKEVKSQGRQVMGVAISVVVGKRYYLDGLLEAEMEQRHKLVIEYLANKKLYTIDDMYLLTGADDEIKLLCQRIVADFDSEHLEYYRKLQKELKKTVEDVQKNQKEDLELQKELKKTLEDIMKKK